MKTEIVSKRERHEINRELIDPRLWHGIVEQLKIMLHGIVEQQKAQGLSLLIE